MRLVIFEVIFTGNVLSSLCGGHRFVLVYFGSFLYDYLFFFP